MELEQALAVWLGPWDRNCADARALYLGAGFTKSCNPEAPLFGDYAPAVRQRLLDQRGLQDSLRHVLENPEAVGGLQVDELIELLAQWTDRRTVFDLLFAEPIEKGPPFALRPRAFQPHRKALPPEADGVYRSFLQWVKQLRTHQPGHWSVLDPRGGAVIAGRLIAEGVVPLVLSTNWDAYAELGAALAGLEVCHDGLEGLPPPSRTRLLVFDAPEKVALRPRAAFERLLLKLHGSVDHFVELCRRKLAKHTLEEQLRHSFLVATSDLTHWRGASQWVQDAVADVLRTHRTLLVGVSGTDPATFRAVRERVNEWERQRDRVRGLWENGSTPVPERPPLAGVALRADLRVSSLLLFRDGPECQNQLVVGDASEALRAAYAWALVQLFAEALQELAEETAGPVEAGEAHELCGRLGPRLSGELADPPGDRRLVNLLCDALGPGARWAALAGGRLPQAGLPGDPIQRWHYATWRVAPRGSPVADRRRLRTIAACALALAEGPFEIARGTGIVRLEEGHRLLGEGTNSLRSLLADAREPELLLLPWPWPASGDVLSSALREGLRLQLDLPPFPSEPSLHPYVVPVPAGEVPGGPAELDLGRVGIGRLVAIEDQLWIHHATSP